MLHLRPNMQSYDEEDKTKEKMWSMIWDLHHFFLMSVSMVRIEEECKSAVPYEQDCARMAENHEKCIGLLSCWTLYTFLACILDA